MDHCVSQFFSGSRVISLIWCSRFGIWKQNKGEIQDESLHERWDVKNNPWDQGIARNFGSGLRDWKNGDDRFTQV